MRLTRKYGFFQLLYLKFFTKTFLITPILTVWLCFYDWKLSVTDVLLSIWCYKIQSLVTKIIGYSSIKWKRNLLFSNLVLNNVWSRNEGLNFGTGSLLDVVVIKWDRTDTYILVVLCAHLTMVIYLNFRSLHLIFNYVKLFGQFINIYYSQNTYIY